MVTRVGLLRTVFMVAPKFEGQGHLGVSTFITVAGFTE